MTKEQGIYKLKRPLPKARNKHDESLKETYNALYEHINSMIPTHGFENVCVATTMMMASFYAYVALTRSVGEAQLVMKSFEHAIRIGTQFCILEERAKEIQKNDQGNTLRNADENGTS